MDSLFRRAEMIRVLRRISEGELHPFDHSGEGVIPRTVVGGDGGAAIHTDVAAVIGGEDHRLRHWDRPIADRLAIDVERYLSALPESTAGVHELHAYLMLASGQRFRRLDVIVIHSSDVVAVLELAILRIETPAANVGASGYYHSLGAGFRNNNLCCNRVRFVLDTQDAVLRQPPHATEKKLRIAFYEHRPAGGVRVHLLDNTVVDGQYIIARRLDQP